jgi:hypothetical protein
MGKGFDIISCDECGIRIRWTPTVIDGRTYCCPDCAVGLECDCRRLNSVLAPGMGLAWLEDVQSSFESIPRSDYYTD